MKKAPKVRDARHRHTPPEAAPQRAVLLSMDPGFGDGPDEQLVTRILRACREDLTKALQVVTASEVILVATLAWWGRLAGLSAPAPIANMFGCGRVPGDKLAGWLTPHKPELVPRIAARRARCERDQAVVVLLVGDVELVSRMARVPLDVPPSKGGTA